MSSSDARTADQGLTLDERREFMKLPLEQRRRQMAEQAEAVAAYYESQPELTRREDWQGEDFVDQ